MNRIAIVLIAVSGVCFAGWFGPSNYEECVDAMRQDPDRPRIDYIRRTCYRKFTPQPPPEPEAIETLLLDGRDYSKGELSWKWCTDNDNSVSVCLEKNDTHFKVTRAEIFAWRIPCAQTLQNPNYLPKYQTEQSRWGGKFTASVKDFYLVQCLNVFWYAVPKK